MTDRIVQNSDVHGSCGVVCAGKPGVGPQCMTGCEKSKRKSRFNYSSAFSLASRYYLVNIMSGQEHGPGDRATPSRGGSTYPGDCPV